MSIEGSRPGGKNGADGWSGHPSGIPVSRALDIRPGIANDDIRLAGAAVNRVHGDGDLPPIPVAMRGVLVDSTGESVDGMFSLDRAPDGRIVAQSIQVRIGASMRPFVALHEIGHFLDLHGLPGPRFASADTDIALIDDWRRAVLESRAVGALMPVAADKSPTVRRRVERLLAADELWARSYAQFVAVRSGIETLRESLSALRRSPPGDLYLPRQWDDDDFVEVDRAIDALFRRLGWIA